MSLCSGGSGEPEVTADDPSMEEDPYFNAEEIAFKVRYQSHKDRKTIVKKLVRTKQPGDNDASLKANASNQLVVLNEANEPEEEEDTYDDVVRMRQQRLA